MTIVIPDPIELDETSRLALQQLPNLSMYDDMPPNAGAIIERIKNAEIVTANFIDLTKEVIEAAPKLKYIISPAVGYDWIDVQTATQRGIKVLNCPTFNSQAVAEHAIGLMFAVKRHVVQAHLSILQKKITPKSFVGTEVAGKTLVTFGHGNIGKRILDMATALGMQTHYIDTSTSEQQIGELISAADVVVLSLPLNEHTKGIINAQRIARMKSTAILINVARGLVVDQEALYQALQTHKIAGAGIDTFPKDEIIKETTPEIDRFLALSNVVATPHIGFNTTEAMERLGPEILKDIESCLKGQPINIVN